MYSSQNLTGEILNTNANKYHYGNSRSFNANLQLICLGPVAALTFKQSSIESLIFIPAFKYFE